MTQILTIKEFIAISDVALKTATHARDMLCKIINRNRVTTDSIENIESCLKDLCAMVVYMLDHKIKMPKLSHLYIYEEVYHHSIKVRTQFETFNVLVADDLDTLFEEMRNNPIQK